MSSLSLGVTRGMLLMLVLLSAAIPQANHPCVDSERPVVIQSRMLAKEGFQLGFSLVGFRRGDLATTKAMHALRRAAGAGANVVNIVPTWYQASWDAVVLEDELVGTGSSREEVRLLARAARGMRLQVALSPHVDSKDGTWRGDFRPGGRTGSAGDGMRWLLDYRTRLLALAELAEEVDARYFVIGTELANLSLDPRYEAFWRSTIQDVRNVFSPAMEVVARWYQAASQGRCL